MLEVRRTGPSLADVARDMRDVPSRVMPYAAATALTKAAKRGQQAVIAQMRASFRSPVAYTLNATRIEVATKDKLFARIAVKDQRSGAGTRPESYLLPEVFGGARSPTGAESLMRRMGWLRPGEWAIPQSSTIMNSAGNVDGRKVRSILAQVGKPGSNFFVGTVGKRETRGLWERGAHRGGRKGKSQSRSVRAIYVFTTDEPTYRRRLDFEGAAATAVRENFASDFYAAAQSIRVRNA